jgi:hypothetical protein
MSTELVEVPPTKEVDDEKEEEQEPEHEFKFYL